MQWNHRIRSSRIFDLVEYFNKELVEGDLRHKKYLNSNRKTHCEIFVKTCEELLDIFNAENDLNEVSAWLVREKIE